MKILVTGAQGVIGKSLLAALRDIQMGQSSRDIEIEDVLVCDQDYDGAQLLECCSQADFTFILAGDHSDDEADMAAHATFTNKVLGALSRSRNFNPVMLESTLSATLVDEYADSAYGHAMQQEENLMFNYSQVMAVDVLVYRFPEVFGKDCLESDTVLHKLCSAVAAGETVELDNPNHFIEILHIDDLITEMLDALEGNEHYCDYLNLNPAFCDEGQYCAAIRTHEVTMGHVVELLERFKAEGTDSVSPDEEDGFVARLAETYACIAR